MAHWLATARPKDGIESHIHRFDPRFWTVNFPRPMMASVVTASKTALRVDAVFYRKDDLAGLIWEAEDRHDHPLLAYETARDFRECCLRFRWRSNGVKPLDAIHGPTLTIEGRDADGASRAWYVRLWNYAQGTPEDATIAIDFAAVHGGFTLPGEADPVFAGDVDRMFVSLVPPAYDTSDAMLAKPQEGWVELSDITCDGPGAVLSLADTIVPAHGLEIASGYDDSYHLTPERLLRNALHLGYRGAINHYVGMSHYFRLVREGTALVATPVGGALNVAAQAWHRDFAGRAKALGYELIWSLSYELFAAHAPAAWQQCAWDGAPGRTGWEPPSALLSPANPAAMAYLRAVAVAFVRLAQDAGSAVRFQVGEPWWWTMPDGRPCLYDAAARAAFGPLAVEIPSMRAPMDAWQTALLDAAGAMLAQSTAALIAAVRDVAPGAETLLLAYLPTILDTLAPEAKRANLPVGWAKPAFDVLQLEDYDWCAPGNPAATARGIAAAGDRLGYPVAQQQYFAGFVLRPEDRAQWAAIDAAAVRAQARGVARTFIWALPQVMRDGFVHFDGEDAMIAFDDVRFPLALGREVEVVAEHSTAIVASAGGHEARNAAWEQARARYDVGPGVRSEADIAQLLAFYRARLGPARAFRLRDPFDWRAAGERLGTGDGVRMRFALVKRYEGVVRRITRPTPGTLTVFVNGAATSAFTLEPGGQVAFDAPPAVGAVVTASFDFDVAVRFAEDSLRVNRATFLAGEAPSVPLVEVREA
ncbi:TIGR02217 family protein [uncultured Sphingomonas sp.]|uniref:phage distal tail protein, Rcc01695 family n=1 Tax=uncultured Sphingomonas sp. TaxID=158754 RepID=UPI0037483148